MHIPSKLFDVLKWVVMVCIPALTTAYVGLSAIWGWPYADAIAKTSAVICVLLGSLLGLSSISYYKDGKLEPPDEEETIEKP